MSKQYKGFVKQNCVPYSANYINIKKNGVQEGKVKIPSWMKPPSTNPLYSFGCISDVHTFANQSYTSDTTANDDYVRALNYFKTVADFTCICGDLTCYGISDLSNWKTLTDNNKGSMPVYGMAGNHEWWGGNITDAIMQTYTGHSIYYSFTQGNDVFIMCGMGDANHNFTESELQWLYETLEPNRNKRCFVFVHGMILGKSGDPTSIYPFDILSGTKGSTFVSLMQHYTNCIYLHGHSHILYESQLFTQNNDVSDCIIDNHLGIYSVHIPSLAIPIDITSGARVVKPEGSQGYLIDVHSDCIILKGMNFASGKWSATGHYKLETTLDTVAAGTYVDPNGIITT